MLEKSKTTTRNTSGNISHPYTILATRIVGRLLAFMVSCLQCTWRRYRALVPSVRFSSSPLSQISTVCCTLTSLRFRKPSSASTSSVQLPTDHRKVCW